MNRYITILDSITWDARTDDRNPPPPLPERYSVEVAAPTEADAIEHALDNASNDTGYLIKDSRAAAYKAEAASITTEPHPSNNEQRVIRGFGLEIETEARPRPLVRINAPQLYRDPRFQAWLNHPQRGPATWHRGGAPGDYSDAFIHYGGADWHPTHGFCGDGSDYSRDGHDPDNPSLPLEHYALIARAVELATGSGDTEALVWLSNLE